MSVAQLCERLDDELCTFSESQHRFLSPPRYCQKMILSTWSIPGHPWQAFNHLIKSKPNFRLLRLGCPGARLCK